ADNDGRAAGGDRGLCRPLHVSLADIPRPGSIDHIPLLPVTPRIRVQQTGTEHRRGLARGDAATEPKHFAGARIETLNTARVMDQLRPVADANQGRRRHPVSVATFLFPLQLAGRLLQGAQSAVRDAGENDRILVQDGAAADAAVHVLEAGQLFAPDELAVEIEGRDHPRAKQGEDKLAVGYGSRHRVAMIEVIHHALARRNERVPELPAVADPETEDVVLGDFGFPGLPRGSGRPNRRGDKDAITPDDGTGMARAAKAGLPGAPTPQGRLPKNVLPRFTVPGERQVFFVGVPQAGRAAPAGPISGSACLREA